MPGGNRPPGEKVARRVEGLAHDVELDGVDVATLPGAIRVALGQQVGGLVANDDALAAALVATGWGWAARRSSKSGGFIMI